MSIIVRKIFIFAVALTVSAGGSRAAEPSAVDVFNLKIDWLTHRYAPARLDIPQGLFLVGRDSLRLRPPLTTVKLQASRNVQIVDENQNITFYAQYEKRDLFIPRSMPLSRYYELRKQNYLRTKLIELAVKGLREDKTTAATQKLELIGADIAGQRVSLQVSGNVNINGRLQNQKRSQVRSGYREGQSTSFLIDQKQQLSIEGKIGDRISILVDQDSERDFDFENALKIIYTGNEDDIVQKVEAGNISLSLPGTQYVTFSGKNTGLFGIKTLMKFGGLDVTAIASVEKGKKEKLSVDGGAQTTQNFVRDYDYRRTLYFFLDMDFRSTFYRDFSKTGRFWWTRERVVSDLEVYKSLTTGIAGSMVGRAYVDPNDTLQYSDFKEDRIFKRLELDKDYTVDVNLGFIRMMTQLQENEVLAVAYRTINLDDNNRTVKEYGDYNRGVTDTSQIRLKLIKPQYFVPSHPCWDLEFKNVYYLGASGINPEDFDLKIAYIHGKNIDDDRDDAGKVFLQLFGLDRKDKNGNLTPDDIIDIDPGIINLQSGELWLPFLRPFQFDEAGLGDGERNPNLSAKYNCSAMYDTNRTKMSDISADQKFKIIYTYQNRSSTINLGAMVIENSEQVSLNGQNLTRGVDYTIDYFMGTLTLLRSDALNPDAKLDVKYEKNQFFQLDKKTIFGARAQYDFGNNSFLGGTVLYYSKSVIDEKVDVGYEPMRNFVWDINGRFDQPLNFLTRAIDRLPVVQTSAPSSIIFEGEIAQIRPNPNTISNPATGDPDGVGFIDDFEGAKRVTSPPIMRRYWSLSSSPLDANGDPIAEPYRGFTYWFNPFGGVPTRNIWPNKEVSIKAQNNITEVLALVVDPEWATSVGTTATEDQKRQAWGGITYPFPTSYWDQSKTKFLEIWVMGNSGRLHVDLGQISEEVVLDNRLSTEDKPEAGLSTGNGLLDLPHEDTGIDGVFDADETVYIPSWGELLTYGDDRLPQFKRSPQDPRSDNWRWSEGSQEYRYINGTEGNSKDVNGLYPDTEDLNANYVLDRVNDYYTVHFNLDHTGDHYVEGRTLRPDGRETGWKLYRIPLTHFKRARPNGDVTWQTIRACRIWMDDVARQDTVWFAKIEMVGNEWEEMGIAEGESGDYARRDSVFAITVINTEDNQDIYSAPAGVQGEYDRINEIRMKEQSLVLWFDSHQGLQPNQKAAAKKVLIEEASYISYRKLKLYVNGNNLRVDGQQFNSSWNQRTPVQFFVRFGRGTGQNPPFYEYRLPVYPGWHRANRLEIDLDFMTRLKTLDSVDEYTPQSDSGPQEFFIYQRNNQQIRHYKEVRDGVYTGHEIIIYGEPALSRINQLEVGVKNDSSAFAALGLGDPRPVYGQVWIDELRLSEVRHDPGTAYRTKMSLKLADIGMIDVNLSSRDADFRTVEQGPNLKADGLKTTRDFQATGRVTLDKFTPAKWGLKIPLSVSYSENIARPKYLPGTDILAGDSPPDSIISYSEQYGFNTSLEKRPGDFWPLKYTIDQMAVNFNATWRKASSVTVRESNNQTYSGKFSYRIPFGRDNFFRPFKWAGEWPVVGAKAKDFKWYYTPSRAEFSLDAAETFGSNVPRKGNATQTYDFGLNRSFNLGYKMFDNLDFTFNKNMKNDMDEYRGDKLRAVEEWRAGIPVSSKESYTANFSPKLISWLTPKFNYSSNYNWAEALGSNTRGIDQLSSQNRLTTSLNLNLTSIMETFYKPKTPAAKGRGAPPAAPATGRGRGQTATETGTPAPAPAAEEHKFLDWTYQTLKKVQQIQLSYSINRSISNRARIGSPSLPYRMGLAQDPGLAIVAAEAGADPDNIALNRDMSVRTGVNLISNITTSFSFSQNMATTQAQGTTGKNSNRDYLPLGKTGKDGLPFPQISVRWGGLEKISLLSKYVRSLSLDHSFSGKETVVLKNGQETNSSYKIMFQPLLGVSMQFKNDLNGTFRVSQSQTTNNRLDGTEKIADQNYNASLNYQKRGGLTLPLPFIKDINLENNITFTMSFDYSASKTEARNGAANKFTTTQENKNWKVAPRINYSFTRKVTGAIFYEYGESFNRHTGKRITRNGGFDVNIAIRG